MTRSISLSVVGVFLALVVAGGPAPQDADNVDVFLDGPAQLIPGLDATYRVVAYETTGLFETVPTEADVTVSLTREAQTERLYQGRTGTCTFTVPAWEPGDATLTVRVGTHEVTRGVRLSRDVRILVTTDKPLYQPGQLIHIRSLTLQEGTLSPAASQAVVFEVEDGAGNKVYKRNEETNAFGIASTDFQLAGDVCEGDYRVRVIVGNAQQEKVVSVRPYVLPKFSIEVETDRPYYEPGQTLSGHFTVRYFFGRAVEDGRVEVIASTFDTEFHEFQRVEVRTNDEGRGDFEIALPEMVVGQPLTQGQGLLRLEIRATDSADHTETKSVTRTVTTEPLILGAIPEGGRITPDMDNRIFIVTAGPDGAPVASEVHLHLGDGHTLVTTDETGVGVATVHIQPAWLRQDENGDVVLDARLNARAADGRELEKTVVLKSRATGENILLRLDRAIYTAGGTIEMTGLTSFGTGVMYVDVTRAGQTLLTGMSPIENGRATYRTAIPADVFGGVEIQAYVVRPEGLIVRDRRLAYINPAQELQIRVGADRETFRPGETANITFDVVDGAGQGVQAALGILVVDEAVYALQEMQPGLEKVFFTLERELAEPKVELHFHGGDVTNLLPGGGEPEPGEGDEDRQEAAEILFAAAEAPAQWAQNRVQENTLQARYQAARSQAAQIAGQIFNYAQTGQQFAESPGNLLPNLIERAGVAQELQRDPWGGTYEIGEVQRLIPSLTEVNLVRMALATRAIQLYQSIAGVLQTSDVVRMQDGRWAYRDGSLPDAARTAGLDPATLNDPYGEPLQWESLSEADPYFSAENLAKMTRLVRAQTIHNVLWQRAQQDEVVRSVNGRVEFVPEILSSLALPEGSRSSLQGEWTLAALAAAYPDAFNVQIFARLAEMRRLQSVYEALLAHPDVAVGPNPVQRLVEIGALTEAKARDMQGRWIDLASNPALDVRNIVRAALAPRYRQIARAICVHLHRAGQPLPEDPISALVDMRAVDESLVDDPWGRRLRLMPAQGARMGHACGLLRNLSFVSAGPNGGFGDEDDIRDVDTRGATAVAMDVAQPQPTDASALGYPTTIYAQYQQVMFEEDAEFAANGLVERRAGFGGRLRGEMEGGEMLGAMDRAAEAPMAGMPPPAPAAEPARELQQNGQDAGGGGGGGTTPAAAPPRIREYFPETLFWQPSLITDERGHAAMPLPLADSITTWRMTVSANSAGGLLGSTSSPVRVFQDFFADIDFPVFLTQNDTIHMPVAVYNYLPEEQTVRLQVEREDWFELMDDAEKEVTLAANEVRAVYFRVRATRIGRHSLTVQALGRVSDAVRREVEVRPDGQMQETALNGRLSGHVTHDLAIPENAIADTPRLSFKVYPGILSQILDGLDSMLNMPGG